GFKGIISDFNIQAEKGNAHFDLDQMIRHNLWNVQNDPILTEYLNNDVPELKNKHQDLIKEFNEYKQRERDFEMLMLREREKTTLLTALQGKNPEIERRNQELERKKAQTPKPEFKPQTRLHARNFEKTSTFNKTLNSWNDMQHARNLSAKMKERI